MVKSFKLLLSLTLLFGIFSFAEIKNDTSVVSAAIDATDVDTYYSSLYDSSGNLKYRGTELFNKLSTLISTDTENYSYDYLDTIYQTSDVDPNNSNKVVLYYTGESVSWDFDGFDSVASGVNREHVWPQSHFNSSSDKQNSPYSDGHHVRPCNVSLNSSRSNSFYDELTTYTKSDSYGNVWNGDIFYPQAAYRGDCARICFYVATRYTNMNLEIVDGVTSGVDSSYNIQMGNLSALLKWNSTYSVSETEIQRNEAVAKIQNNRNPFIDHPEFADYIWGDESTGDGTGGDSGDSGDIDEETPNTGVVTGEKVTIDFSSQGYTNAQSILQFSNEDVTINFSKASGNDAPKYYNTGTAVRTYAGNTISFSSEKSIASIKFGFGSGDGSNTITSNVGTFSSPTWDSSDTSTKDVTFTIGGSSGHRKIQTITITFYETIDSDEEELPINDLSNQTIQTKLSFSYKKTIKTSGDTVEFNGTHTSISSGTDKNGCSYLNTAMVNSDVASFGLTSVTKAYKAFETGNSNNHIIKLGTSTAVGSATFDNVGNTATKITFKASGWVSGVVLNVTNGDKETITLTTTYSEYSIVIKDVNSAVTITSTTSPDGRFFLGNIAYSTSSTTETYEFNNFLMRYRTTIEKELFESIGGVSFGALINSSLYNPVYEDTTISEFDSLYASENKYLDIDISRDQIFEDDSGYTMSAALTNIPLTSLTTEVVAVFYIKTEDKVYFTNSKTYSVSSLVDSYLSQQDDLELNDIEIELLNALDSYIG